MKKTIVDYDETLWMIPYFQGGYDEAKKYTPHTSKRVNFKCPICGRVKEKSTTINSLCNTHSIGCICNDGIPYTEKVIFNILEQLKTDFIYQFKKINDLWCENKIYDFCFGLDGERYIIETHGIQHYVQTNRKNAKTLEEEQENDIIKKELALANGIKKENYIVIDCRYSDLEFIKRNVLDSNLATIFDLSKIDWNKVEEFALSNLVKEICVYWNDNGITMNEIAVMFNLCPTTVSRYISKGIKLNWVNKIEFINNKDYSMKLAQKYAKQCNSKQLKVFKDGVYLGKFNSTRELERISLEKFGVNFNHSEVSKVCR